MINKMPSIPKQRAELFAYKVYPSFVNDLSYGEYNFTSEGKIKFTLGYIVHKNLEKALKNIIAHEEITDDSLDRLLLYPVGVAEYWKQQKIGYHTNETCLGLFLNKEGVNVIKECATKNESPSNMLNMKKHFYIKQIKVPYGDVL